MKTGKESLCGSCNEGYKLIKGKCKKIENLIIGIYNVKSTSNFTKIIQLSSKYGNNLKLSDFIMYINGEKVEQQLYKFGWNEDYAVYKFGNLGNHEIKIIFNKTLSNMNNLFSNCDDLIMVEFSETIDTSHVLSMESMFYSCDNLKQINISSLNTSITGTMQGMFSHCHSLTSLDLTNFDTRNVYSMQSMFESSEKLSYIDLSSFETTYLYYWSYIFDRMGKNGTIIINSQSKIKYDITKNCTIIYKN